MGKGSGKAFQGNRFVVSVREAALQALEIPIPAKTPMSKFGTESAKQVTLKG